MTNDLQPRIGRRALLAGGGVAAAAATMGFPTGAAAEGPIQPKRRPGRGLPAPSAAPEPIPGTVDSGDPNVGLIHWWLPGPTDASTPILEIPGFGLDVDPSTITNFKGVSALAVVAGKVKGTDGVLYDCEFDVRAMKGEYVAADGVKRTGAFAFM